jgi:uncharacterized membrane protein YidH (DUF202 family)
MNNFLFRVRFAYRAHPARTLLGAFLIYFLIAIALWIAASYFYEADHAMTEAEDFLGYILTLVLILFSLLVSPFLTSTKP